MAAPALKKAVGNSASTTLASAISNTDTSAPLASDTNFSAEAGEGIVLIDEGSATEEIAYSTGKAGSSLTIPLANRGLEGGSAQPHAIGASVKGTFTVGMWNDMIESLVKWFDQTTGNVKPSLGSDAQGDIYYRNSSGVLARLAPGTSGHFLKTQGAAADPVWAAASAGFNSGFSAYASAGNYSIPASTFTKLQLNTEVYDLGTEYDNATNYRFTAGTTGKYLVTAAAQISALTSGKKITISIYKNGTAYKSMGSQSANGPISNTTISAVIDLSATDYIEIFVHHNEAGALDIQGGADATWAMAQRLV